MSGTNPMLRESSVGQFIPTPRGQLLQRNKAVRNLGAGQDLAGQPKISSMLRQPNFNPNEPLRKGPGSSRGGKYSRKPRAKRSKRTTRKGAMKGAMKGGFLAKYQNKKATRQRRSSRSRGKSSRRSSKSKSSRRSSSS